MGRMIDTDKIIFREIDEIGGEYEPYLGCSKSQIDSLPTVEAIPKADYENRLKADMVVVLDKIRTEIETKYGQCDICEYFEDYDYEENDISEYRPIGDIADILQIIDKYKSESEADNRDDD